jgi:AraC-like DNA-binding protein
MNSDNDEIQQRHFENKLLDSIGLEVITMDKLRNKLSKSELSRPERIDFYILMYVIAGTGVHTVDFVTYNLEKGTLVVVRPGQLQQWQEDGDYSAILLLVEPTALPYWDELSSIREKGILSLLDWETHSVLPADLSASVAGGLQQLDNDLNDFDGSELEISLIRHELFAILLRIARWQKSMLKSGEVHQLVTYRLFLHELEDSFRKAHSLKYYAKRLGYSPATISRACLAAEGRSAKIVIDRRIALEGKRMLFHSTLSVTEIAYELGFSELTNFITFFKRLVGMTPIKFRQQRTV